MSHTQSYVMHVIRWWQKFLVNFIILVLKQLIRCQQLFLLCMYNSEVYFSTIYLQRTHIIIAIFSIIARQLVTKESKQTSPFSYWLFTSYVLCWRHLKKKWSLSCHLTFCHSLIRKRVTLSCHLRNTRCFQEIFWSWPGKKTIMAQSVKAIALHAEDWIFKSKPRQAINISHLNKKWQHCY